MKNVKHAVSKHFGKFVKESCVVCFSGFEFYFLQNGLITSLGL